MYLGMFVALTATMTKIWLMSKRLQSRTIMGLLIFAADNFSKIVSIEVVTCIQTDIIFFILHEI